MTHQRGMTLVETLVAIVIVLTALSVVVVLFPRSQSMSRDMQLHIICMSYLRQQMVSFFEYASNNNGYFPGVNEEGNTVDATVASRYQALLTGQYILSGNTKMIICPAEEKTKTPWTTGQPMDTKHFSYALINLSRPDELFGRKIDEGEAAQSAKIPTISDRAIRIIDDPTTIRSPHKSSSGWRGAIAWGDGHVLKSGETVQTMFEPDHLNEKDYLFDNIDASMVYRGVDELIDPGDAK